ncbi:MAG: hypothetical protein ACKV2T_25410 [Kofleriaceae bacterium]
MREDAVRETLAEIDVDQYATIEVFATVEPLAAGTEIATEWDTDLAGPKLLVTLDREAWLFFADFHPGFMFEHDAKLIVVYSDDLAMESFDVRWWPVIDGLDRWRTAESRGAVGEKVFAKRAAAAAARPARDGVVLHATVPGYCMPDDIQKWALTIGASDDIAVEPRIANELGLLLKVQGYQADVLQPGALNRGRADVFAALANVRTKITMPPDGGYCDELFVAWNGHGSTAGDLLIVDGAGNRHWTDGAELAAEIDKTTAMIEGMQVRVAIDSCYSGFHIPTFLAQMPVHAAAMDANDVVRDVHVITGSTATEQSVGDILPGDTFLEDIIDCINDAGGVDFGAMLMCTRDQASTQTPQEMGWWNNGA